MCARLIQLLNAETVCLLGVGEVNQSSAAIQCIYMVVCAIKPLGLVTEQVNKTPMDYEKEGL